MMHGMDYRMPKQDCPYCRAALTAAWHPKIGRPRKDDITICLYCGGWLVFTARGKSLRQPTAAETREIAGDRDAQAMHRAWVRFQLHLKAKERTH